eukprot:scaffold716_cov88-Cylindrotheca_fusiformis.AAC.1
MNRHSTLGRISTGSGHGRYQSGRQGRGGVRNGGIGCGRNVVVGRAGREEKAARWERQVEQGRGRLAGRANWERRGGRGRLVGHSRNQGVVNNQPAAAPQNAGGNLVTAE